MKKLLLVLFAVGLITVFSMPAVAADVKFFGDYYVAGYYSSNYSMNDTSSNNESRSTYGTRLRVNTIFQVAEGLKLTTRFDALERAWSQETIGNGTGTNGENNISWERAYVTFNLGPGFFDVGYQADSYWSPIAFGNTTGSQGMIRYTALFGPTTVSVYTQKVTETQFNPYVYEPGDYDRYAAQGTFKWKSGQAGLQFVWDRLETGKDSMTFRATTNNYLVNSGKRLNYYELSPFVQAKLGPLDLEAKVYWSFGSINNKTNGGLDKDIEGLSAYANAKFNIGPAYVGGMFSYIKGQNPTDNANVTLSHGGGQDWDPTLILGNDRYSKWQGGRYDQPVGWGSPAGTNGPFKNANPDGVVMPGTYASGAARTYDEENVWIYQSYAGVNPSPALALRASFTILNADHQALGEAGHIGNELDLTAAYKIYPNLEYMIGFGYLWAGDWFKNGGTQDADNNYLLMHQLTLTF